MTVGRGIPSYKDPRKQLYVSNSIVIYFISEMEVKMFTVDESLCKGCGKCVKNCPQGAITLIDKKAHIDPTQCRGCGICMKVCPAGAIKPLGVEVPTSPLSYPPYQRHPLHPWIRFRPRLRPRYRGRRGRCRL
ncbi:MAG: 4Fe-4S dicluster domain-containing protein [Nitrospiraceae bacterium]|nr:4Fe-4S dicluster domain-containing protein [Nitrospiraceae bacterium]